jgi:hypothetical protein
MPPEPGPAPVDADPLAEFLKLAQQEGALEGENLEAFVTGLRERADRVIAERLGRADQVIAERLGRAETKLRVLEKENQWQRDTVIRLEAAVTAAGEQREKASASHESLLAHHRELMARLAGQLGEIASLSPLRALLVRRRLRALADLLRADTL